MLNLCKHSFIIPPHPLKGTGKYNQIQSRVDLIHTLHYNAAMTRNLKKVLKIHTGYYKMVSMIQIIIKIIKRKGGDT